MKSSGQVLVVFCGRLAAMLGGNLVMRREQLDNLSRIPLDCAGVVGVKCSNHRPQHQDKCIEITALYDSIVYRLLHATYMGVKWRRRDDSAICRW